MVHVDAKEETSRMAKARAGIRMERATFERIRDGSVGKGDVLGVAKLAAISASKLTAQLIPLAHPIRVTGVDVDFFLGSDEGPSDSKPCIVIHVEVRAVDRTGPEMEAMNAAAAAALTIYDMCKAMDRSMEIESVVLLEKSGGKGGHWQRVDTRSGQGATTAV